MALIILAHPDFNQSIANKTVIEHLQKSGLSTEIRDIASLYPDWCIDVAAEQRALLRHSTIVFQYPLYWYNMPAILKHYFDSVLTYGFAYGQNGDKLKGKNFVPSITTDRELAGDIAGRPNNRRKHQHQIGMEKARGAF